MPIKNCKLQKLANISSGCDKNSLYLCLSYSVCIQFWNDISEDVGSLAIRYKYSSIDLQISSVDWINCCCLVDISSDVWMCSI